MRTLALGLLSIAGLLAASFASAAVSGDELYPVEVLLTTTSDWTDVRIVGGTLVVESYDVVEGAGATDLAISAAATLAVSRALHDERSVTVRFRGYLAEISSSWMQIRINKGHLGDTTVSLLPRDGSDPLVRYTHRGVVPGGPPENSRTFSFRASEITSRIEPEIVPAPSASFLGGLNVLAFYYPWYGTPDGPSGQWVHWDPRRANRASTHVPAAGYYDSLDPETVRRHVREAKAAGIDGFIASWWGLRTFEDRAFQVLLDVAEEEGFLVTVYYEDAQVYSQIVADVSTILSRYASSPAFLHVGELPVIFFYVRVVAKFTLEQWETVFRRLDERGKSVFAVADRLEPEFLTVFQGLHTYNPVAARCSPPRSFPATRRPLHVPAVRRPTGPTAKPTGPIGPPPVRASRSGS